MKTVFKKTLSGLMLASTMVLSAQVSAYTIIDDWYIDGTSYGGVKTTNIGNLQVVGGSGTIVQDYGPDKVLNAGDTFSESGFIYGLTYAPENVAGSGDSGANFLGMNLELVLTGLTGHVSNVTGGAISYVFDDYTTNPGANIALNINGNHALDLSILSPSGGEVGDYHGGVQVGGNTDLLLMANPGYALTPSIFGDSATDIPYEYFDLLSMLPSLLFDIHTTNTLASNGVTYDYVNGIDDTLGINSATLLVASNGSVNLAIPEPGSLALLGLGLIGLGAVRRRKSQA